MTASGYRAENVGSVNAFGGGLAPGKGGQKIGGLRVSDGTSCTDHMVAWRVRYSLSLDGLGPVAASAILVRQRALPPSKFVEHLVFFLTGHG